MTVWERFPDGRTCPACGTGEASPCVLVPVDGTRDDGITEAVAVHTSCLDARFVDFRLNRESGVLYRRIAEEQGPSPP